MNKAIFLDRDGTINVDKHYLHKIEDFEFMPSVVKGLRILQDAGYLLIIITNQSGIGRGYYSEDDYQKLMVWMTGMLQKEGVKIAGEYFCPHLPDAKVKKYRMDCNCRKPKLGLFQSAIIEHEIDVNQSWAIGDRLRDCSICEDTECRGVLIGKTENKDTIRKVRAGEFTRIVYAKSLYEASKIIVGGQ